MRLLMLMHSFRPRPTAYELLQNPLAAQCNEAVAANGRLQATIDGLHSAPNPLQTQLVDAVAANERLQATMNALKSAPSPSADELKSKNQEIKDLRKEIQRLTSSESDLKKQAEEFETKLGSANQQIEVLQQTIDNNTTAANTALKVKEDLLNAAEFKLSVATRNAETLEKEVRKPQAENEVMLDTVAEQTEQEKKEEEEKEEEKKEEEKEEEDVVNSVPGGWNDDAPVTDPFDPSSADLLDAASSSIQDNVSRKVSYVQEAALHAKYMAHSFWHNVKNTLFWLLLRLVFFLSVFGKDVFLDETPTDNTFTKRVVEEVPAISTTSSWIVGGLVLVFAFVFAVYQHVKERKAKAERLEREEADRQLRAAVQANCLACQQAEWEEKQKVVERWQESARQLPPYYFESMRTGWTPPCRSYYGNNL